MSEPFYIYGLREVGSLEVRYVGQTRYEPAMRLEHHRSQARVGQHRSAIGKWLNENAVEAIKLGATDTREQARGVEKTLTALCQQLGFRLFNLPPGPKPKEL